MNLEKVAKNVECVLINPPWESKNFSLQEFEKIKISKLVVRDGLVMIWSKKEYISEIMRFMNAQDFTYVENIAWVMLDKEKEEGKIWSMIILRD